VARQLAFDDYVVLNPEYFKTLNERLRERFAGTLFVRLVRGAVACLSNGRDLFACHVSNIQPVGTPPARRSEILR